MSYWLLRLFKYKQRLTMLYRSIAEMARKLRLPPLKIVAVLKVKLANWFLFILFRWLQSHELPLLLGITVREVLMLPVL